MHWAGSFKKCSAVACKIVGRSRNSRVLLRAYGNTEAIEIKKSEKKPYASKRWKRIGRH